MKKERTIKFNEWTAVAILIFLFVVALSGCATSTPVTVEKRVEHLNLFHPPLPDGVHLDEVKWLVLTPKLMQKYLNDLKVGKAAPMVIYAITPDGYEALSGNVAELKRYIKGQKAIIMYYRNLDKKPEAKPKKEITK